MSAVDVKRIEAEAYRESFSDGVVDLVVGIALLWIGATWLLLGTLVPLAAAGPPILAIALFPVRQRLLEPRVGYVRWTAPRRRWERRQLVWFLFLGVLVFGMTAAIASYAIASGAGLPEVRTFAPAVPALLVVIPAVAVAVATGLARVWLYILVLVIAAGAAVALDADPGWPLLIGGLGALLGGVWLLARFLRANPRRATDV